MIDSYILRRVIAALILLGAAWVFHVQADELMTFSSSLNQARYESLTKELRCPKCQNQDLADSGAGIAKDLRKQIHDMIEDGRSDKEIVDYMVARYGDFVLYRPKHNAANFVLWYGPFILLAMGLIGFVVIILINRRRRQGEGL